MRKMLFTALTLALIAVATLTSAPKAEATTYCCNWQCGECGLVCLCDCCRGPIPFCVCQ